MLCFMIFFLKKQLYWDIIYILPNSFILRVQCSDSKTKFTELCSHHHSLHGASSLTITAWRRAHVSRERSPLSSPSQAGTVIYLTSILPVVPSVLLLIVMLQRQYIFGAMTVGFIASNGIAALMGMCFCNLTDWKFLLIYVPMNQRFERAHLFKDEFKNNLIGSKLHNLT